MKKIIYSPGEPSGIGPDLIIQLCKSSFWTEAKIPILCLSDPSLLLKRAQDLGKKITLKKIYNLDELETNQKNVIQVFHISDCADTRYGKLYKANVTDKPLYDANGGKIKS